MVAQVSTFAFHGVEARPVTVEVQLSGGGSHFAVVGLPDKAVSEARERVQAALTAIGLGLPPKRITVNLAPADLPKEGSHFDLPIALGLLMEMGAAPKDGAQGYAAIGELGLDGSISPVAGALPSARWQHAPAPRHIYGHEATAWHAPCSCAVNVRPERQPRYRLEYE